MATSAVTFTLNPYPNGIDPGARKTRLYGTVAVGAGNYATNGLPVTFSAPGASGNCVSARLTGVKGVLYSYDPAHGTIRIFEGGADAGAAIELSNGAAIGAEVTGDTISVEAVVNKV